jgi:hypothetical protein
MTDAIKDKKEMYDLGLAVIDLSYSEWVSTKDRKDQLTEVELIKIGEDMELFDIKSNFYS